MCVFMVFWQMAVKDIVIERHEKRSLTARNWSENSKDGAKLLTAVH
ncbi:hypothetical protein UYSO10_1948 [Kosakonia radicincitans]|nr:hypothetical protein UYSO10_1948 [Kosakonia radicincitans]